MKKVQMESEHGRAMALSRYAKPEPQSTYGHAEMDRDVKKKFETPMPKQGKKEE